MPTRLRTELDAATARYTDEVVSIIRRASLADILAETKSPSPTSRPLSRVVHAEVTPAPAVARRPTSLDKADRGHLLLAYLRSHPGSSGEEIKKALGLSLNSWRHFRNKGEEAGTIRREGENQETRYWAAGGGA